MKTLSTINPNAVPARDALMVRIINGATKAGVQKDRKREASRRECRRRVRQEEA